MKNTFITHSYKILSLVLIITMIISMLPATAFAEAEPDDNTYATSGVTASGTEDGDAPPDDEATPDDDGEEQDEEQDGEPDGEDENEPPADEETPEPPAAHSIVAFAPLTDSVAMQTVTVDATLADLTLPESLDATVSDGEAESAESIGGVTWATEPEFEAVTVGALEIIPAGTYVFTPTLPQGYALADGVALPVITVEVEPMGVVPATSNTPTAEKDIYGTWSVFANGTAITVKADSDSGETKIYSDSDKSTPLDLFSGSDSTSDPCIIYGGWKDGDNTDDTSVTIEGNTSAYLVYGGSLNGTITGSTSVTIKDMTASATDLTVYGGGRFASVTGDTSVTIENSTISGAPSNGIYGGGNGGSVTGNTSVYINNSTIGNYIHVYGGCQDASVTGNASVAIDSSTVTNNVYGGGYTSAASVGSTSVEIKNGADVYMALGGGESGSVDGNTSVSIVGSTITNRVFGGGNYGNVAGNVSIGMTSSIVTNTGSVFGGGCGSYDNDANIDGNVNIVIENSEVTGWVYGGGGYGSVTGDTSVTLTSATVGKTVFGGGCWDDSFEVGGNSSIVINGGIYAWVYGGGDSGPVKGNTSVDIKNAVVSGGVFGGGGGWDGNDATVGSSTVTIESGEFSSVYGGGDEANVTGAAIVNIYPEAEISGTITSDGYENTVVVGTGSKINYWHEVVYDLNGGTGTAPTQNGTTNGYIAAGTDAFTAESASGITPPSGKQFKAWNTKSDGQGTNYAVGGNVTIATPSAHPYDDFTLYAIWEDAPITDITAAAVTITAPVRSANSAAASVSGSANYTHTSTAWKETTSGAALSTGSPFAASTAYTATIILTSKSGYKFADTVQTSSVSGTNGTVAFATTSGSASGNTLTIVVNYTATDAAPSTDFAPTINGSVSGTDTINLTEGYASAHTKQYTIDGNPAPSVSITGTNTAGTTIAGGELSIPTGLTASGSPYTATITATNSQGTATMTVMVNVTAVPGMTDAQKVAADTAALTFDSIKGGNTAWNNITVNLTQPLPSIGAYGSTITWSSDNTAVIANDGTVTRPEYSASDASVTVIFTATITSNGVSDTGTFYLIVKQKEQKQTDVVIKPDTPQADATGLDGLFTPDDDTFLSSNTGASIEYRLEIEQITAPAADVTLVEGQLAENTQVLYLDVSLWKEIAGAGASDGSTKLDNAASPITITITLPRSLWNKDPYTIIRVHDDGSGAKAETITPSYDSTLHTLTFTTDKFSTYAIAYTQTSPPNPPVPPTSPPSNGGSSSGGNNTTATASTAPTQWVDASDAKTLAKSATEQGADSVRTSSSGEAGIRKKALQTLGKSGLTYRHDTVADRAVQVRVYVDDPSAATKDILTSGYTSGANVDKTTAIINKWFSNDAAVIALDQQGDFGMNVRIAARVNLSGLDTSKLNFYSYNKATNKYKLIATEYRIDSKGYVHFSTVLGGSIIITDSPLTKIGADAEEDTEAYEPPMTGGGLENPTTGGDGTGMYIPPVKAQPQDFTVADSIIEAVADDGVLKLESNSIPAAVTGNAVGNVNSGGVLKINLDAPNLSDVAQESGKPSVGMIVVIAIAAFFVAMILWAVIPRKDDPLLSLEEYRKKQ